MVSLDSSAKIWHRLLTHYASHTRTMVRKLKLLLMTPKNDRSIYVYINDIKKVVDSLVVVGFPFLPADHIDAMLYVFFCKF